MTYAPMQFPAGSNLPHRRPKASIANGRYGKLDAQATDWDHLDPIGPCNLIEQGPSDAGGEFQQSPLMSGTIGAPPNSDVKPGDQFQMPSGEWLEVIGEPTTPTNPFTGWQPHMRIRLERQRFKEV